MIVKYFKLALKNINYQQIKSTYPRQNKALRHLFYKYKKPLQHKAEAAFEIIEL